MLPFHNMAYPQGFEPCPAVLETVMLPLTPGIHKKRLPKCALINYVRTLDLPDSGSAKEV